MTRKTTGFRIAGFTIMEVLVAAGITTVVLATLITGALALQRSFAAAVDYSTAQDDQMRISDYLSVDMRRALAVDTATAGVVAVTLPNFYQADGSPNPPTITSTTGWPSQKKKKKKNKHRNIIMDQTATYDPASTVTVKYYKGSPSQIGKDTTKFYRESGGVATAIANGVADFNVSINGDATIATTQVTFQPRFRVGVASSDTRAGTTLYQTTVLRNAQ